MTKKYSLIMLGSGAGSTIEFFCQKAKEDDSTFRVAAIVTENPKSPLDSIAKKYNVPFHLLPFKKEDFTKWDTDLKEILKSYSADLVLLAGFLKKIGSQTLSQFPDKIINSHPSLLPDYAGMYGSHIHRAVINDKKDKTGISIHIVNEEYDKGLILHQETLKISQEETALELEKRVKGVEKTIYLETVLKFLKK